MTVESLEHKIRNNYRVGTEARNPELLHKLAGVNLNKHLELLRYDGVNRDADEALGTKLTQNMIPDGCKLDVAGVRAILKDNCRALGFKAGDAYNELKAHLGDETQCKHIFDRFLGQFGVEYEKPLADDKETRLVITKGVVPGWMEDFVYKFEPPAPKGSLQELDQRARELDLKNKEEVMQYLDHSRADLVVSFNRLYDATLRFEAAPLSERLWWVGSARREFNAAKKDYQSRASLLKNFLESKEKDKHIALRGLPKYTAAAKDLLAAGVDKVGEWYAGQCKAVGDFWKRGKEEEVAERARLERNLIEECKNPAFKLAYDAACKFGKRYARVHLQDIVEHKAGEEKILAERALVQLDKANGYRTRADRRWDGVRDAKRLAGKTVTGLWDGAVWVVPAIVYGSYRVGKFAAWTVPSTVIGGGYNYVLAPVGRGVRRLVFGAPKRDTEPLPPLPPVVPYLGPDHRDPLIEEIGRVREACFPHGRDAAAIDAEVRRIRRETGRGS